MIIIKFGGSSISDAAKINRCAGIVLGRKDRNPVIILSALGKTTNNLLEAAERALAGCVDIEYIEKYHYNLINELGINEGEIRPLFTELREILHGISLLKELTQRTLDRIASFGERLSTRIFALVLCKIGLPAVNINSFDAGLLTDSSFGSAKPLSGIDVNIKKNLAAIKEIPVITGFIAKDRDGNITTLGRSGSDYSAALFGAALDAEEIQIWTDVDGVMTADPSVCENAMNLPVMSFLEAGELAYYGAEVLHPGTLIPAVQKNIPIRVINSAKPEDKGTVILQSPRPGKSLAKSIVYKENLCLVNVESYQAVSAAKLLSNTMDVLTNLKMDIHIASTSESSVSFVTQKAYKDNLLEHLSLELKNLGKVSVEKGKAIICVVGEELRGQAAALGMIFSAIGQAGINARMVSQSASEINVAFIVEDSEIESVVGLLHRNLFEIH